MHEAFIEGDVMAENCGQCRDRKMCRVGCMLKRMKSAMMGDQKTPSQQRAEMNVKKGSKSVAEKINFGGRY